jgi:hypothetical protein
MGTYTRLSVEASLAALVEAIVRARGGEPRQSKYDRPWVRAGITRGAWYRKAREGRTHDARYSPRVRGHWHPLPRRPANGAEAIQ